jgi:hypothetical protein
LASAGESDALTPTPPLLPLPGDELFRLFFPAVASTASSSSACTGGANPSVAARLDVLFEPEDAALVVPFALDGVALRELFALDGVALAGPAALWMSLGVTSTTSLTSLPAC